MVPGRSGRLLEALHARGLSRRPLRSTVPAPVLPLPSIRLRRAERRAADRRTRAPAAPAAAARDRPARIRSRRRGLLRARRTQLLGRAVSLGGRTARWFDDRLRVSRATEKALGKVFP